MIGFLDIETGGFSIAKNGICEIAMISVHPETFIVTDEFHASIKPYTRADDTNELVSYKCDAMTVNGLKEQDLIDYGLDVKEVCEKLLKFIVRNNITIFGGHCSNKFDIPRLTYLFDRFLKVNFKDLIIKTVDTHDIAKRKLNLPNYKLETLCEHFGIVNEKSHSALGDTYAAYKLYQKLII